MSSEFFLKIGSKEWKLNTFEQRKSSNFMTKNHDIILIIVASIFATFSYLVAYEHIPMSGSFHPMFISGSLAMGAIFIFIKGISDALFSRGCLIVRGNSELVRTI